MPTSISGYPAASSYGHSAAFRFYNNSGGRACPPDSVATVDMGMKSLISAQDREIAATAARMLVPMVHPVVL